jgi:transcriptional regulator with XRE-family HTH domain
MGRAESARPVRLGEKLLEIRRALKLSQNELLQAMGRPEAIYRADISAFELYGRIPPVLLLLRYARLANICVDVLIDDEIDLPARLPAPGKRQHGGLKAKRKKPAAAAKKKG